MNQMKLKTFIIFISIVALFLIIKATTLGVNASNDKLNELERYFPNPLISKSGKSYLTVNKMGFDVLNTESSHNWLLSSLSTFFKESSGKTILDVGSGYGKITHMALEGGHNVIANDLAEEHLIYTRKIARSKKLNIQNLYLNNKHFPEDINFDDNSLDAVILYRVIHFLSGSEVETGFRKIHDWLKPGGKIFIAVLSPYHKAYSEWFLPQYEIQWEKGNKWPGDNLPVRRALPDQEYNLPEYLNVMDERPLRNALEIAGFDILEADFIDMSRFNTTDEVKKGIIRSDKGTFGIIAIKK